MVYGINSSTCSFNSVDVVSSNAAVFLPDKRDNNSLIQYFKRPENFHNWSQDRKVIYFKEKSFVLRILIRDQTASNPLDFSKTDLRDLDLSGIEFGDANLKTAWLHDANVQGMKSNIINIHNNYFLMIAYLKRPDDYVIWSPDVQENFVIERNIYFRELIRNQPENMPLCVKNADLRDFDLSFLDFINVNFKGANFQNVNLNGSTMENCILWQANLQGVYSNTITPENNHYFRMKYLKTSESFSEFSAEQQDEIIAEKSKFVRDLVDSHNKLFQDNIDIISKSVLDIFDNHNKLFQITFDIKDELIQNFVDNQSQVIRNFIDNQTKLCLEQDYRQNRSIKILTDFQNNAIRNFSVSQNNFIEDFLKNPNKDIDKNKIEKIKQLLLSKDLVIDDTRVFLRKLVQYTVSSFRTEDRQLDLSSCDLRRLNLKDLDLRRVIFHQADMRDTKIDGSDFSGTDMTSANLSTLLFERDKTINTGFTGMFPSMPKFRGDNPQINGGVNFWR